MALPILLVTLVSCYITMPLLVLIHELGHARAAVRAGRRPVVIVGKQPALIAHRFRSFELQFHPRLALDHFYPRTHPRDVPKTYLGECVFDPRGLTVAQLRSIFFAGPHASILTGFCLSAVAFLIADLASAVFWIAAVGAGLAWVDGIGNLIPTRSENRLFSDGAQITELRGLDAEAILAPFAEGDTVIREDGEEASRASRQGVLGTRSGRSP